MTDVVLALGSNLGERMEHLRGAVDRLRDVIRIEAVSPVVESPAREVEEGPAQGPYLNAVIRGSTRLAPEALLDACLAVEEAEGRTRSYPHAPRTLDVDVLFYGDRVIRTERLRVPHPRWKDRDFVLAPLRAVAPDWTDPETGRPIEEIARERLKSGAGGSEGRGAPPEDGTLRRVAGPEALHETL